MTTRRKKPSERKAERKRRRNLSVSPRDTTVNPARLAPNNSYTPPDFVVRGFYLHTPFTCRDCGTQEVWTATQQKWWYEVAGGDVFTVASRCRRCRRREQARKAEARRIHLDGLAAKAAKKASK